MSEAGWTRSSDILISRMVAGSNVGESGVRVEEKTEGY